MKTPKKILAIAMAGIAGIGVPAIANSVPADSQNPVPANSQNPLPANPASRPNVILIVADDLGFNDISANGGPLKTPNIDRIALAGTRFSRGYAPSATSTPSRYGILTGTYPWRRKIDILPGTAPALIRPETPTLATLFKSKNYATAAIGKWHLGLGDATEKNWNAQISPGPNQIGFDFSYIMAATNDRVPCVYFSNGFVVNTDANDQILVSYQKNFDGEFTGRERPDLLKIQPSHGHADSIVNGISRIGFMKGGNAARWVDETMAQTLSRQALGFVERAAAAGTPFFMYYALHQPHVPRVPNAKFAGKSGFGPRGDVILEADAQVGELLDFLDNHGLRDNTLIIFTSDNGPVLDDGYRDLAVEHARAQKFNPAGVFRGGKYSLFEGGTRVPVIVSWPAGGVPAGATSSAGICTLDLFADFAKLLDADVPAGLDSQEFLDALLNRGNAVGREEFVVEAQSRLALRRGNFVYIPRQPGPPIAWATRIETGFSQEALFDLADDPAQKHNLLDAHPDLARELRERLEQISGRKF